MTTPEHSTFRYLRWRKVTCPRCEREHEVHVMRIIVRCPCGCCYVDVEPFSGWYESHEAFENGKERIAP